MLSKSRRALCAAVEKAVAERDRVWAEAVFYLIRPEGHPMNGGTVGPWNPVHFSNGIHFEPSWKYIYYVKPPAVDNASGWPFIIPARAEIEVGWDAEHKNWRGTCPHCENELWVPIGGEDAKEDKKA